MSRMVEVVIDSVRVSLTNQQRIVVLRESDAERYLPIWIGPYEAEAITIALQEVEVARPQTHDLLKNVFSGLNARLLRVEVISLRDEVFYGNIVAEVNGRLLEIDSRPSDALALAVRAHIPVLVAKEVMDAAGIIPEQDIQQTADAPASSETAGSEGASQNPVAESSEERLSVFEDFLQNLNLGDLSNTQEEEEEEDDDSDEEDKPRGKA
ncbi:MAG TPA: bifunctional nuclease family protein [Anaerolineaceae bacterium]|nr:bifunctional nuclease family protein [Anaerolineaceae bacterium]